MRNFDKAMSELNKAKRELMTSYTDSYDNCPTAAMTLIESAIENLRDAAIQIDDESSYNADDKWQDV